MKNIPAENMDEYITGFPKNIQKMLEELRAAIRKAAPQAGETIKYAIPTFTLKGNLVSFGAWKTHIGFYPAPREIEEFKEELSAYAGAKSTVQFPIDKPLPLSLIGNIVKYRVKKNLEKAGKDKKR
ncbi:MAG: DUF1801 domain-containing protein [Ferruginibacter sp.]|nr:DUF1801 domain-containing protein [Ferruginibacter sp.]